mmetsp:Transcript_34047/g.84865  ORF Transcript_34047/g.84865 Transcript_34047/m.84865 type:complete len:235 (+) Transcript_34047:666-1370(+)
MHRVLVCHRVVWRVVVLEQLGHDLEVVHVRMACIFGDERQPLQPVRRGAEHLVVVGGGQPADLRSRERLAQPEVVDEVRGVHQMRLVIVIVRVKDQPQRPWHLSHLQVPSDTTSLWTVQQTAGSRDHLGAIGHLDVAAPRRVVVEVCVRGVRREARFEVYHRQLRPHQLALLGGRRRRGDSFGLPGEAGASLVAAAVHLRLRLGHRGAVQVVPRSERAVADGEGRCAFLLHHHV